MKRFLYVCADRGVPLPGTKGSSIHVESVVRALSREGLRGEVHVARARGDRLGSAPLFALRGADSMPRVRGASAEAADYLLNRTSLEGVGAGVDFIYERYSLWHTAGLARARELGVPLILEVNSPLPEEARRHRGLRNQALARGIAGLLLEEADGVVCVSERVAEWVAGIGRTGRGVWVVPNGFDPELFAPGVPARAEVPWDRGAGPVIVFCGSFRPWHALDDLLDAFRVVSERHLPSARLLCVGDGPMRERFEERARRSGVAGRVHVTGAVPQREVPGWLAHGDVAVAPYRDLDGFYYSPLKVFEFMAMGLPIVAASVGQVRRVLEDGRLGRLYRAGDAGDLAHAIADVLTAGRSEARRRAAAAADHAARTATWRHRVRRILDEIEGVGGMAPSRRRAGGAR